MKIQFQKQDPMAVIPTRAHETDAGFDLTAVSCNINNEQRTVTYDTGIAVAIPRGYVGLVFPRSSVFKTGLDLSNCVGVIDSGYRGTIHATFNVLKGRVENFYEPGQRIAQLIILPYPEVEYTEVDNLDTNTDRGTNGYGSTGK